MPDFITINTAAELICFAVALFCLHKDEDPLWRFFILFLLITLLVEMAGIYLRRILHQPNFMLYNVFLLVECVFESYFFYHLYKPFQNRLALLKFWLVLFVFFYSAELYRNHFGAFVIASSSLMSVVLVLACVYFYYQILKEEEFRRLSVYAPFWWVSGTLFFYFGSTACNIFFNYLVQDKTPVISRSVRYMVFNMLNIVLYLNWSYAFICRYRQRILSSSSD